MNLREAHAADIEAIARLHAESWRATYRGMYRDEYLDGPVFDDRRNAWQGRLTSPRPGQYTVVAENGDGLAGFACAFADHDAKWGTLLDNIHVAPERKRAGVGTMLMRDVAFWAERERPAVGIYLWVIEANAPARRFYERLGARNAERATFDPPGRGTFASLRYVWPNPAALIAASGW